MRASLLLLLCVGLSIAGCSGGGGDGDGSDGQTLSSSCVERTLGLDRTIPDGYDCLLFSVSSCGVEAWASECVNVCAFEVCQQASCTVYQDCAGLGAQFDCQTYTVGGVSYGSWCGFSSCPRGTPGCPCLPGGSCYQTGLSQQSVACTAGTCVLTDTCPYGCRVRTVCCGGAFCGGDCVGTPCC
jgi:hypothetical protein